MSRLEEYQDLAQEQLRQNTDLLYMHTGIWSDGTDCRFRIKDPNETDAGYKLAQRLTGLPEVQDVRLLYVHPDDARPGELATLDWDGGLIRLMSWGQVRTYTKQAVGVCRFSR